jgi:DNA polymerase-1
MKKIFHKEGDIHLFTGAGLSNYMLDIADKSSMVKQLIEQYNLLEKDIKPLRQNAKAVNFGLIYKMTATGLRNYAYQGFGVKLTDRQSNEWRREFFRLYPGITPWHDAALRSMEEKGQITTIFGRKIPVPNIYSDERKLQAEAERFGVNALVQGPSSDYTLLGGESTANDERYDRNECKAVLFIHDAIVWEVDIDKVDKYAWIVKENMEKVDTSKFGFKLSIPFVANAEVGFSLAETEEYKF